MVLEKIFKIFVKTYDLSKVLGEKLGAIMYLITWYSYLVIEIISEIMFLSTGTGRYIYL